MKAYNPPSRIGRAARSFQGGEGMEPRPMERVCFATIIVATLMLHGFEPVPCRAQSPAPPPSSLPPALPPSSLPPAQPHPPIPPPRPAREFEAVKLKQAPLYDLHASGRSADSATGRYRERQELPGRSRPSFLPGLSRPSGAHRQSPSVPSSQ